MKLLALIIVLLSSFSTFAKVNFYWGGITSITLTDGEHTIMIDPVFNRPPIWKIALNGKFKIDPKITEYALKQMKITKVDAIFSSHTHHDHYADAPVIAKKYQSKVYGTQTSKYLSLSSGIPEEQTVVIKSGQKFQIGKFTVTPLAGFHAQLFNLFDFLPGELTEKVSHPIKLWNYKMGGSFSFLIEHPEFVALAHETSRIEDETIQYLKDNDIKVDYLFQGIANRKSTEDQHQNLWRVVQPKYVIPTHHDNFLFSTDFKEIDLLPAAVNFDEFREYTIKNKITVIEPQYFKPITVEGTTEKEASHTTSL